MSSIPLSISLYCNFIFSLSLSCPAHPLQLRNHLLQAQRYQNQPYSLKFDNPDTIQTLVDVRFEQLECSISVDLWQVCVCVCVFGREVIVCIPW